MPDVVGPEAQYEVFADEYLEHARDGLGDWLTPLEQTCEELHEAGFLIERLLEPRPTAQAAVIDAAKHERLSSEPTGFLAIKAIPMARRPAPKATLSAPSHPATGTP